MNQKSTKALGSWYTEIQDFLLGMDSFLNIKSNVSKQLYVFIKLYNLYNLFLYN